MARIALAICTFFFSSLALAQIAGMYDTETPFVNPLDEMREGCSACVDIYRVNRPIAPLVFHVFVGAHIQWTCEEAAASNEVATIYGGTKGKADLVRFERYINSPREHSKRLRHIGRACGEEARLTLDTAVEVSEARRAYWKAHPIQGVARVTATPILGRPCADAAKDVIEAVSPYLN